MTQWKQRLLKLPELPRKWKIVRNLLLTAITLQLIYILNGAPAFTLEQAFRREEKRHFVGPARIVTIMDTRYTYFDKMIIADDGDAVIFCEAMGKTIRRFHYRKTTGDTTILIFPNDYWRLRDALVRIIVWDKTIVAESAVLTLTLHSELDGIIYKGDYLLKAKREHPSFFLFTLEPVCTDQRADAELNALQVLQRMADPRSVVRTTFPATVSFFDADNELISEVQLIISSEY